MLRLQSFASDMISEHSKVSMIVISTEGTRTMKLTVAPLSREHTSFTTAGWDNFTLMHM